MRIDETEGADDRRKVDALLRFHYGVDPQALDEDAYWQLWGEYEFAHRHTREMHLSVMRQVLSEAFPSTSTPS